MTAGDRRPGDRPRTAIVVGAGIVGLSTAWFLQERGVDVTVVDRVGVAAGSSWGNAGWIAPALTIPLNEPGTLGYGLRAMLNPAAPLRISPSVSPQLWRFLARFAVNCRRSSWVRAARANLALSAECLSDYGVLVANGVDAPVTEAPITALFTDSRYAEHLLDELQRLRDAGQPVSATVLSGNAVREQVPLASATITAGVRIDGQRFVDAARFVQALGRSVVDRGAALQTGDVVDVRGSRNGVTVHSRGGAVLSADVAVVAAGAWLSRLVRRWVRVPVQAGRGYSFTVPVERAVPGPVYLPEIRVACTPLPEGLRVTSTMEIRDPDAPPAAARVAAMCDAVRPMFDGVRWDRRSDTWVGPRPLTPDGRPLIGRVSEGVFVAGGHGMWGMTHGPVTGRLLAQQITTGAQPAALREFDPLR
ncbi:FAD-dependent oxidoreductase [Mycobacterium sp.]|uniref:NAD(P)/FAD-dependent oxidoreductase n=1 Tax=Mycobacterium sp. TaxID=1785 RepID=UPI0031DA5C7B